MKIFDLVKEERVVAAKISGQLVDLSYEIKDGDEKKIDELVYFDSEEGRNIFWHSSAHLLAHAVKLLFPSCKLAIGPAIENGFYYDFAYEPPFTEGDLVIIEEKMRELVEKDLPIEQIYLSKKEALDYFKKKNESFKLEILQEISDEMISLYRQGDFIDLCLGPHLPRTGMIKAFKLLSVAGAYWKGDARNQMLSRIYGISFPTEEELNSYLEKLEEAKKRDHRRLGPALELFAIYEEAGSGLIYWLPNGAILRRIIEDYWVKEHIERGYQLVYTPEIGRENLWKTSGHLDYYQENIYFIPQENDNYVLKPMNCPGHILIYRSKVRSYKELPIRICELGTVYRRELSGVLFGTLRVRGFTQDDAHIFCSEENVEEEIFEVLKFALSVLKDFGFTDFHIELSRRDPARKELYMGTDREWELAENALAKALKKLGLNYKESPGEAVFYGPKIDLKLLDYLGREFQTTTIQFDFNLSRRFNLSFMGKDGQHHPTTIIHRTILGSLERFLGILIEHYGGAFPVWLAPHQLIIMTITDKEIPYADKIKEFFKNEGIRIITDYRNEKINYKIAEAERMKVPYMIIIGKIEVLKKQVSLRKRKAGDLGRQPLEDVLKMIKEDIKDRR